MYDGWMKNIISGFVLLLCGFGSGVVFAESYVVPLRELAFEVKGEEMEGVLKAQRRYTWWELKNQPNMSVRVPDGVMAYVAPKTDQREQVGDSLVAIEMEEDVAFSGFIDVAGSSRSNTKTLGYKFSFDPKKHEPAKEGDVERVKGMYYTLLSDSEYVGNAWFNAMSGKVKFGGSRRNMAVIRDEFSLYSGGRAIADNLALNRDLRLMKDDLVAKVDVDTLEGVQTEVIDWEDLMPEGEVAIDKLAMLVPEDQHVLVCPSLAEMDKIVSLVEKEGAPLFQSFTVRNPFRTLPSRYKKQLGLNFPAAFAKLAPVKSVAVTGYDPFFPTGTDVAVLLESDNPGVLFKMLGGVGETPSRKIALVGDVVVVTNSEAQLDRIKGVHAGKVTSLGSLDEYRFFRHRYPIAEKQSGYVFLSDACIRRWAGPRLRIAASRRTKSVASLNYLTARSLSAGEVGELSADHAFLLGGVSMEGGAVVSEKMGSLHFMTPSIEIEMDKVTKTEADAYSQWRRGYEEGWRNVFDPIGFSFSIDDKTRELDLTVMPLTVNSGYDDLIDVVGDSVISRRARIVEDEHVFMASVAVDKDGEALSGLNKSLTGMMPSIKMGPLSWLGDSVSVFVEKDEMWKMLGASRGITEEGFFRAPIGLRIEHTSQIKLASFLVAVKGLVATAAPDAVKWDTAKHGEVTYAVVTSKEDLGMQEDVKLYYVITKDTLIMTLREDVIKREIDRLKVERKLALSAVQEVGDHFYIKSSSRVLMALSSIGGVSSFSDMRRKQSYRAIPILNEWKRKYEEWDPAVFHFAKFGEDVFCPGGKGYVWNEEGMTMESVVYGYPALPKEVDESEALLDEFGEVESGMKFENDGLRLRFKISETKGE